MNTKTTIVGPTGLPIKSRAPQAIPPKTFTPTGSKVALFMIKAPLETETGIQLPETMKEDWTTPVCVVVACGPECKYVKPGDRTLSLMQAQAFKIRHAGAELLVVEENSIMGVIDEPKPAT